MTVGQMRLVFWNSFTLLHVCDKKGHVLLLMLTYSCKKRFAVYYVLANTFFQSMFMKYIYLFFKKFTILTFYIEI